MMLATASYNLYAERGPYTLNPFANRVFNKYAKISDISWPLELT